MQSTGPKLLEDILNMSTTSSIFLCHSSKDKSFVRQLSSRLKTYGIKVWLDEAEIRIGDSLINKVGEALQSVDYVAVVLSINSISSAWVEKELNIALHREFQEQKIVVLPILLNQVQLPVFLSDKLYADFSSPDKFEDGFKHLLEVLGTTQEHLLDLQSSNFEFHTLHHFIKILDPMGHKASWCKQSIVTPTRSGIDLFRDEQFHGTGNLRFVKCKPGIIDKVYRDGGAQSVITRFNPPLKQGKKINRSLYIESIDCYTEENEDFSWIVHGHYEEFGIHLALPAKRPFHKLPKASYTLSTQDIEMPPIMMSDDRTQVDFVVRRPLLGAKYSLKWQW